MSDEERLRDSIIIATVTTVNLLARGEYGVLESMTEGRFLSAAVLEQAVAVSGQTLVEPPQSAYDDLHPVQEPGVEPPTFRVSFPLWSEEQGVSELALELRFMEEYPGVVGVEILSLQPQMEDLSLTHEELDAVIRVVRALVEHDSSYLQQIGAYDRGQDPYQWTRDYGRWDHVDLVMPPGDPQTWIQFVYRTADPPVSVGVEIWTEQEGRSDLTLEIEIGPAPGGTAEVRFRNLHVM